jgi:hypothetical protein
MDLIHSCSAQFEMHVVHSNHDPEHGQAPDQRMARWWLLVTSLVTIGEICGRKRHGDWFEAVGKAHGV